MTVAHSHDTPPGSGPLIFLIAGEPSGDALGAGLMAALRRRTQGRVRFAGVGGEQMKGEGLEPLFPMDELAIIGLIEVLPRIPRVLRRIREISDAVIDMRPAAVVTIDSPDFTFRVAARLRRLGAHMPLVHYVAPQVWAWRPGKAKVTAQRFDHLMVLLPFEPSYFEAEGLPTTYVGHPAVGCRGLGDGRAFRRRHSIPVDAPVVGIMPGSRRSEVSRLLPLFQEAIERVKKQLPRLQAVVPAVSLVMPNIMAALSVTPVPTTVVGQDEKLDAFSACDAALAASGTVTLELAVADVPMVVAYRVNPLTATVLRRMIKAKYATIANLVLDRPAVPELLQESCTPNDLATALGSLLTDAGAQRAQRAAFAEVMQLLGLERPPPPDRAAAVVLSTIREADRGPAC